MDFKIITLIALIIIIGQAGWIYIQKGKILELQRKVLKWERIMLANSFENK